MQTEKSRLRRALMRLQDQMRRERRSRIDECLSRQAFAFLRRSLFQSCSNWHCVGILTPESEQRMAG
jgi:hypothetical protein